MSSYSVEDDKIGSVTLRGLGRMTCEGSGSISAADGGWGCAGLLATARGGRRANHFFCFDG